MKKVKAFSFILVCAIVSVLSILSIRAKADTAQYVVAQNGGTAEEEVSNGYRVKTGTSWNSYVDINAGEHNNLFDITENKHISMRFSIGMFDSEGNAIGATGNGGNNLLSIQVMNKANDTPIMSMRIETTNGGALNADHNVCLAKGQWDNQVWPGKWITGMATADSSFYVEFSKEKLFQSYCQGDLTQLDTATNEFYTANASLLDDVTYVYFRVIGDNGWTNPVDFTLMEINGSPVTGTKDTTAPIISGVDKVAKSLEVGAEYTLPVTASDLSGSVEMWLTVDGTAYGDGLKINPTTEGDLVITIHAKDASGNEATKEVTISIISSVSAPTLSNVPTFAEPVELPLLDYIVVPQPTVESEIAYTLTCKLMKGETEIATATLDTKNEIKFFVPLRFESGDYSFIYTAENEKGSVSTDPIAVKLTVPTLTEAEWIQYDKNHVATNITENGIEVVSDQNTMSMYLGQFDLRYEFRLQPIVTNVNSYFNLVVADPNNPSRKLVYRIWPQASGNDNGDSVYVYGVTLDGDFSAYQEAIDHYGTFFEFEDCGWAVRKYDGVDAQYLMGVDVVNGIQAEKSGGYGPVSCSNGTYKVFGGNWEVLATGLKVNEAIRQFFDDSEGTLFNIYVEAVKGSGAKIEFTLVNAYGQDLKKDAEVNNAKLFVKQMPEALVKDTLVKFDAYGKDLTSDAKLYMNVTYPDGTQEKLEGNSLLPTQLGTYKVKFEITGANGSKVESEEYTLTVKTSTSVPTVTIPEGSYNAQQNKGDEITIVDAVYDGNYDESTKLIEVVDPTGAKTTVTANSKYTFEKVGVYHIVYTVKDDAEPTPNEGRAEVVINVPDTAKPVINAQDLVLDVNAELTLTAFTVTDDSEYEVTFKITYPDKTQRVITSNITLTAAGEYKLEIKAVDAYDNEETKVITITVNEKSSGGDTTTKAPDKTTTEAPKDNTPSDNNTKKGCKNALVPSILGVVFLLSSIVVIKRKREE